MARHKHGVVYSLFDGSGYMAVPWAENGYRVFCINADGADHGGYAAHGARERHENITFINAWIYDGYIPPLPTPDIIFAFPPCTDLAVSGAAHFSSKRARNPLFQEQATATARAAETLANLYGVPFMIENPVSVLSTLWRKPDFIFHPYEYGGYLGEGDTHPAYPDYIAPRDAYPKKTCLWVGNGFILPPKRAVAVPDGYSTQHNKLGGKSERTKIIRSLTPRGFARAVFESNRK